MISIGNDCMYTGSIYLLSVIVGITFLAFGSVDSAHAAVDTILDGLVSCEAAPLSGFWAGNTCTLSGSLTIDAGDSLTISNGVTLAFPTNSNLINRGDITNSGIIIIDGTTSSNGQLRNLSNGNFINLGTITISGFNSNNGVLRNANDADFTNSGTITLTGTNTNSGQLRTVSTSDFTNSGTITLTGTNNNSGQLRIFGSASFTNSGTITLTGTNSNSGQVRNFSILINSGTISTNNGFLNNDNPDSNLTNSGSIQITLVLDNTGGVISNNCGDIAFGSFTGNTIEEKFCQTSFSSTAYEDPTIGKSHNGRQMVENGICIDSECWTVTATYHQDFELVEMLSDSTHTITTTVFCQNGVNLCNYVAYGVSPYGTNINDSIWKVILQKDHNDNWTMEVIDEDGYLGEVTSTTQIIDNRYLTASATIEFIKSTPGMILNVEVRDTKGGYRDFKFNDGIAIVDSYAYPPIESSYEEPIEIKSLCLYENPDKRYTCAFEKTRDQSLIDAQKAYDELIAKQNYHNLD